uniref:UN_NPL4 domain-containing protein n=1 Tax=Macrostomum lignano TaxID=282301 RepID=A0A1I8FLY4_9PLAT
MNLDSSLSVGSELYSQLACLGRQLESAERDSDRFQPLTPASCSRRWPGGRQVYGKGRREVAKRREAYSNELGPLRRRSNWQIHVQERTMKAYNHTASEMILYTFFIGFGYLIPGLLVTNKLFAGLAYGNQHVWRIYGCTFIMSITGYVGMQFVLLLVQSYGALPAVTALIANADRAALAKGTQRLEVGDTEKLASLYSRAAKTLGLPESSFQLNRRQANGKQQALPRSRTQSVASVGLKHGDSLFVRQNDSAGEPSSIADSLAEPSIGGASVAASVVSAKAGSASTTPDDPLDVELDREDGSNYSKTRSENVPTFRRSRLPALRPLEPLRQ